MVGIRGYTGVSGGYTGVYGGIRGASGGYTEGIQGYTWVYGGYLGGYTVGLRGYTVGIFYRYMRGICDVYCSILLNGCGLVIPKIMLKKHTLFF